MALTVTPTDEMKTLKVGEKIYEIVDDQAREDVSEVKADFLQSLIYDTASGSVATFPDGAHELPCKSVVAQIVPVQDLHGYDSPWPAGGGKNLFNGTFLQGYWAYANGAWISDTKWIATEKIPCKPSTYYTASADNRQTRWQGFVYYDNNGDYISSQNLNNKVPIGYTVQTPANAAYLIFNIAGESESTDPISPSDVTHFQLEEGQTATSYAPYSNICPISGWDAVNVTDCGKNLANPSIFSVDKPSWSTSTYWLGLTANADGTFTLTRPIGWGGNGFVYIGTYKAGTYTISYDLLDTAGVTCGASFFAVSTLTWQHIAGGSSDSLTAVGRYRLSVELSETAVLMLAVGPFTTNGAEVVSGNYQVELGSTATRYEPYTGSTYSVNLPQTVYGGQVDVVSGEGKVTYGMVDLGTLSWMRTSPWGVANAYYAAIPSIKAVASAETANLVCSEYVRCSANAMYLGKDFSICQSAAGVRISNSNDLTADQFESAMSGVMLAYELATPTDFEVTPQEVPTLYGSNTVYADSGDVAVEYPADTKLYINKVITDAVSAHPEAIVVNDGTITRAKLDDSVGQAVDEVSKLKADLLRLAERVGDIEVAVSLLDPGYPDDPPDPGVE